MIIWSLIPLVSFCLLWQLEKKIPAQKYDRIYSIGDWVMNLSGFFMQGLVIPLVGCILATYVFPYILPDAQGVLAFGIIGSFLLNIIGVDFLYYWQHRAFHQVPLLWKLHAPHHYSPMVNIWTTSRNALITHFLFVYMLVNPVLGYLCDAPVAFFAGAMVTAALDLFRHSNVRVTLPILQHILVMPKDHHCHHDGERHFANYGANFIIWDKLFKTSDSHDAYPRTYSSSNLPRLVTQLLYPWKA